MKKYNNKYEEETAKEVLMYMVIIFCVIIVIDYVTM
tara:strand:- start:1984 stop:2091 length:108 start_codon:yes stop_codon:yes gene_type:complete